MCITQDCPNPSTEGVWWRDDAQWVLYTDSNANSIKESLACGAQTVDLGTIQSAVHPNGDPYMADLIAMQQYNVRSGYRRQIHVVEQQPEDRSSSEEEETVYESSEEEEGSEVEPRVHYRDKQGNLQQYSSGMARHIIGALAQMKGKGKLVLDIDTQFSADLGKMKHIDKHSGECMDIIVEVPMTWVPNSLNHKQFLSAVLEQLSLLDCCSPILEERSSPHQIVSKKMNPNAKAGTKRFTTFVDTLLEMDHVIFEDIMKQMWKIVSTKQNDESDNLQYVFQKEATDRKRNRESYRDDVKENESGGYTRVPMLLHKACNVKKFKFVVSMAVLVYDDNQKQKGLEGYIPMKEIKCAIPILTIDVSYVAL